MIMLHYLTLFFWQWDLKSYFKKAVIYTSHRDKLALERGDTENHIL